MMNNRQKRYKNNKASIKKQLKTNDPDFIDLPAGYRSCVDLIKRLLSQPRRLIMTILIGNELVNVTASEIGLVSADRIKLRHDAAKGSRGAKLALHLLKKPEWLLSTTLVGTNIAVVTNTTVVTALMLQMIGERGK